MLSIFIIILGSVAALLPGVALWFAVSRWFVPATLATREEELGRGDTTQLRPRLALSYFD
jgi:hypothetical protein